MDAQQKRPSAFFPVGTILWLLSCCPVLPDTHWPLCTPCQCGNEQTVPPSDITLTATVIEESLYCDLYTPSINYPKTSQGFES